MNTIIKPTLILSLVTLVASIVLSYVNNITEPEIEKLKRQKQEKALIQVLPGYGNIEIKKGTVDGKEFQYWQGIKKINNKEIYGFAFLASKPGYSGDVKTMVGVDQSGKIIAISITQQTETPGFGARSVEISKKTTFFSKVLSLFSDVTLEKDPAEPWFQAQFTGLDLNKQVQIVKRGNWNLSMRDDLIEKNAISAITGATITTRTVKNSIENAIEKLKKVEKLLIVSGGKVQ